MFEASNGIKIDTPFLGYLQWEDEYTRGDVGFALDSGVGRAMAEFFQAKRDEELGRWRSKKRPDWVVYPSRRAGTQGAGRAVQVYSETLNKTWDVLESSPANGIRTGTHLDVAREWFEAHPKPKRNYLQQFNSFEIGTKFSTLDEVEFVKTGDNQMVRAGNPNKYYITMAYFSDVGSDYPHWEDYNDELKILP